MGGSMAGDAPHSRSPILSLDGEGIARVDFDAPDRSANVLSEPVMRRLAEIVGELRRRADAGEIRGVLFTSGKPSSFIVGADIDAIAEIESPEEGAEGSRLGQRVFLEVERLPVPTVTAIHGSCMGGGTELGLACRYRVASDHENTKIGLPEVQLGILPAWGGTTRLPRLVGLRAALDLLLTGRTASAGKARRIGLVDDVLPSEGFTETARAFLEERIREGEPEQRTRRGIGARLLDDTAPGRRLVLAGARRRVQAQTGGHYPAPLRILDVVRTSFGLPIEEALEIEARAAGELIASVVCHNLIHVFRLREGARKGSGVEESVEPRSVSRIGIVGAGTMGGGIAQLAAFHGIEVRIKDVRHEAVSQALRHADDLFRKAVKKRKLSRREADRGMERISGGVDGAGMGPAQLVVEAVVEKLDVKRAVFRELEAQVDDDCILATNTSSLSVDAMADSLRVPERVIGMHFFNPVHRMPLVEVVRGEKTHDTAVATVYALALQLGKVPVVVRDSPGFLVNRVLGPYLNEAGHLLAEGASIEKIDRVAREFGMPMGPLRLIDEVGFDVAGHAGRTLHEAFGDRLAPSAPLTALERTDRPGRKGDVGFYRYDGRKPKVDDGIYEELGLEKPGRKSGPLESDIRSRLVLAMINEGARALDDGVVGSAADVDLAMIMGTGFPPFRGGLLRLADDIHARALVERLERYEAAHGPRFAASPLLLSLAREDRGFYDAESEPS